MKLVERFWKKVERKLPDECWPWIGSRDWKGYGQFYDGTRLQPAHRVSWSIHHDTPFPDGKNGCHSCNNPPCVNPHHIYPATQSENLKYAYSLGRMRSPMAGIMHCKHGHEFTPENTRMHLGHNGYWRICRACARIRSKQIRGTKRVLET